jgi:hydroxymethylbilane synthase
MKPPTRLVIASRQSRLALWQAEHLRDRLAAIYPSCETTILGLTTQGDRVLDRSLAKIGGKGLFIKELEEALLDGRADLAVHSMKDVPAELTEDFVIGAVCAREDARDAWVSADAADPLNLPRGAKVGTSSLRRAALLRAQRVDLQIVPLRGNLDTRLAKLDAGECAGIVLASAGLLRLGLARRIRSALPAERFVPAIGQGALAIEHLRRRGDLVELLAPIHDVNCAACVDAERAAGRVLNASCQTPLGVHAQFSAGGVDAWGFVASVDGQTVLRARQRGDDPTQVGTAVAAQLLAAGAAALIREASA